MCVWSAYIGQRNAAEALWEMGKRIEGFWSGYYTGMVTYDGSFHSGKTIGTTGDWEQEHRLGDFPGHIGMFHSRTGSGGGREWAHPFLASDRSVALVGQGSPGIYQDLGEERNAAARRIVEAGRRFASADRQVSLPRYPALPDGAQVHFSEIMVQLAALEYESCGNPAEAVRRSIRTIPLEAVFVFLFRDFPDTLFVANIDQRAVIARGEDGLYLATSALAFAPLLQRSIEIPGNTIASVAMEKIGFETIDPAFRVDETIRPGALPACIAYLKKHGPATLAAITDNAIRPFYPEGKLVYRGVTAYQVLETLAAAGWLTREDTVIEGFEGKSAARTLFGLTPDSR